VPRVGCAAFQNAALPQVRCVRLWQSAARARTFAVELPFGMARTPRAIVPEEPKDTSAWSAVVLMISSIGAFALLALFLANNHRWTDALMAALPSPGAVRLASDGIVAEQLRVTEVRTEHLTLSDRTVALLLEATVVNDASIPIRGVVLEVEGFREGKSVGIGQGTCGKNVSVRLLKRLSADEVTALMELEAPQASLLDPGARSSCQVALVHLRTEVEEVDYRIASAEPTVGHPETAGAVVREGSATAVVREGSARAVLKGETAGAVVSDRRPDRPSAE
jgi:hypothetical protein